MYIITSINAKGGCGKSTIAMNLASGLALLGYDTLLIDMDPQAQVTQWLGAGDGLRLGGTLASAFGGAESFDKVIQPTRYPNLSFVAASEGLEDVGRQITDNEGYATMLTGMLVNSPRQFTFVVIDSPNQISPIMENAIYPSDLFIVPFESTKAVRSYANFFKLLMRLRPGEEHRLMHVLVNLSRQQGLRNKVIETMAFHGIPRAETEVRTCGWLAQVDEHGGSIFDYRPYSKGAADMAALRREVIEILARENADLLPALSAADAMLTPRRVVSPSAAEEFVAVPPEVAAEPIAERAAIVPPPEPLPTNLNPQS
ncbi:MAG: ParA family protein [Planctomycetia bacterium]|nr:ParA family protein [Planctomycetia bacterium]